MSKFGDFEITPDGVGPKKSGNRLSWMFIGLFAVAILLFGVRMLLIKIPPGSRGVLNAEWHLGLVEKDYEPGYQWNLGPLHTWTIFDTTVQTLHMTEGRPSNNNRSSRSGVFRSSSTAAFDESLGLGDVYPALLVKSKDGATVSLDVTFKYRLMEGATWRVLKDLGPGRAYADKARAVAIDILRPTLGNLVTEQFYSSTKRKEVAAIMKEKLQEQLASYHIELIAILIRDLRFEETFEARIKEKVLAVQDRELNIAQTRAAEARGRTAKIEAETGAKVKVIQQERDKALLEMRAENDKQISTIRAEWRKDVAQMRSDADLFAALKEADGVKLRREAEADGEALRSKALTGEGSSTLVALQFARNLRLGDMTISTQAVNPLDVDAMLERLGLDRR